MAEEKPAAPAPAPASTAEPVATEAEIDTTKFRFVLPDGQTFESSQSEEEIFELYPDAVITHTVEVDPETGRMTEMLPVEVEEAPAEEPQAASLKPSETPAKAAT